MITETTDTERQVKVITYDFAVLRYLPDTPINFRRHALAKGRHSDYSDAVAALDAMLGDGNPTIAQCSSYLTIEERSETWEEDLKCTCQSMVENDDGSIIHYEECELIQAAKELA